MIMPDKQTSISRCLELALHTAQMLGTLADSPRLAALIPRIHAGAGDDGEDDELRPSPAPSPRW